MAEMKIVVLALATAGILTSGAAQAALKDRGGGLLYDDVLNVTWLQDANYAKTSGYDADGKMTWAAANTWATNLSYGGYEDWRLAANTPVGANWNYNWANNGNSDRGYNITSPNSELAYMYYVNLGLKGMYSASGVYQPDFGVLGNGNGGQANIGLVNNLQSHIYAVNSYWSGTANALNPNGEAWFFRTYTGAQSHNMGQGDELYAWAVRSGDVAAPIPEPETYAMMLAGLGLLGVAARRRKQKSDA